MIDFNLVCYIQSTIWSRHRREIWVICKSCGSSLTYMHQTGNKTSRKWQAELPFPRVLYIVFNVLHWFFEIHPGSFLQKFLLIMFPEFLLVFSIKGSIFHRSHVWKLILYLLFLLNQCSCIDGQEDNMWGAIRLIPVTVNLFSCLQTPPIIIKKTLKLFS